MSPIATHLPLPFPRLISTAMLILCASSALTGNAQNQVGEGIGPPLVQTPSAAGTSGPVVKATVTHVEQTDTEVLVTMRGEGGQGISQSFGGLAGDARERLLHDYRVGSVHDIQIPNQGLDHRLRHGGPFRGTVHKDTSSFFGQLTVTDFEGKTRASTEFGPLVPAMDPVLAALLKYLQHGQTYEFPHALDVALKGSPPPGETSEKPPAQEDLLTRYLGLWEGSIQTMPDSRIQARYLWNEARTALWREMTFWKDRNRFTPPHKSAVLIAYDPVRKAYAERIPADPLAEPLWHQWNARTRKVTFESLDPVTQEKRLNTATFVTPDRIEWQTTSQTAAGKTQVTSSGHYQRIPN